MIRTDVDVQGAIARLERGSAALKTLETEVFPRLKGPLREDQRDHARSAMGPDGPWPARKEASRTRYAGSVRMLGTVGADGNAKRRARYERRDASRGRLLGKLGTATQVRSRGLEVYARSVVKWAHVHRDGGRVNRGAVIPARPFLWISDDLAEQAERMITNHISEALAQ